jgi:hypothetical protein
MRAFYAPRWRGFQAALAALLLAGCFGSFDEAVEETRSGLIGKTGREIRECLGVPSDFDTHDDQDYLTYRWTPDPEHRTPLADYGGVVIGRREQGNVGTPLGTDRSPDHEPFCELDFVIASDGVKQVTATGRDEAGLRADSTCMMRARSCVDGSYKDDR